MFSTEGTTPAKSSRSLPRCLWSKRSMTARLTTGSSWARERAGWPLSRGTSDGGLDDVVMAVAGGVVALAVDALVLLVRQLGGVEAVRGGELEALSECDGGRVVVVWGVHLETVERTEAPADGIERGAEFGKGVPGRAREHGQKRGGLLRGVGSGGVFDDGDEAVSGDAVEVGDGEEVAGDGVGLASAGEVELVVGAEAAHDGDAGVAVGGGRAGRVGARIGGGGDGEADGAVQGVHNLDGRAQIESKTHATGDTQWR